jgi:hypothetical protein
MPADASAKTDADKKLEAAQSFPARLVATGTPQAKVTEVRFVYELNLDSIGSNSQGIHAIDLAPRIAQPIGQPAARKARVVRTADSLVLENKFLRASFGLKNTIQLQSLYHEYLQKNVLAHPEQAHLFLLEVDGKRFAAKDFTVRAVTPLPKSRQGVSIDLFLPEHSLAATLRLEIDENDLRMGLEVKNAGTAAKSWKTAFPQVGGIVLSPQEESDYYLYPYLGGLIADKAVHFRAAYGGYTSWWQMVDLFSPQGGAGLSLRVDDTQGEYKLINFRKGTTPTYTNAAMGANVNAELLWKESLASAPGSAIAIEYSQRTRAAGQSYAVSDAVIGAHSGDWHTAMKTYADWAHRVWKFRPLPEKFRNVWSITTPGWGTASLFEKGKFRTDYYKTAESAELMSWWEWSKKAPWGVDPNNVAEIKEKLGERFYEEYLKGYLGPDGATPETQYSFNPGDYEYHKSWGGLPALKTHIQDMKKNGVMPMLYTCPPLVDGNSEFAKKYGAKWGIKFPISTYPYKLPLTPEGYIGDFGAWNMCIDNKWYQDHLAATMKRIVADTGTDGIRMDVFGYPGYTCNEASHNHLYAEPGHNAYVKATSQAVGRIRQAVDSVRPGVVLTAEYPGMDEMTRHLEGSIVYECSWNLIPGIRTLPSNVFRFYFPEHKMFDLDDLNPASRKPASYEFTFWNGMGRFGTLQHPLYHRILQENGGAFNSSDVMPLIPTLVPSIYANQFNVPGKSLTTLFNARRFTVNGPQLTVNLKPNEHLFELVRGQAVPVVTHNGKQAASLTLRANQAACIARLQRQLSVQTAANGWSVQVQATAAAKTAPLRLVLCTAQGMPSLEQAANAKTVTLPRPTAAQLEAAQKLAEPAPQQKMAHLEIPAKAEATYIKLMRGNELIDAIALPNQ